MLATLLELEALSPTLFRAHTHLESFRRTLFGGQVVAQALMAAGLTTDQRSVNSLHAYFLAAGKTTHPIDYEVDVLRDGRSFLTRGVKATQDGVCLFTLTCSFHIDEKGYEHQLEMPAGRIAVADLESRRKSSLGDRASKGPIAEIPKNLEVEPLEFLAESDDLFSTDALSAEHVRFWVRTRDQLPDTPLAHACALAFASDLGLLASTLLKHDTSLFDGEVFPASLDHAIWFHRPANMYDWLEYITESPWAGGARGYARGALYDKSEKRIASTCQEGLIRPI